MSTEETDRADLVARGDVDTDKNKDLIRRWIDFADAGFTGSFDRFIAADDRATSAPP